MSCCSNKRRFCGLVTACDPQSFLDLFKELEDGNYIVRLEFLDSVIDIEINAASNVITGTVPMLNENYTYNGKVLDAERVAVDYFTNFEFKTTIQYV